MSANGSEERKVLCMFARKPLNPSDIAYRKTLEQHMAPYVKPLSSDEISEKLSLLRKPAAE